MASRCVSAISDLNPEIAARGKAEGCYRGVNIIIGLISAPWFHIHLWLGVYPVGNFDVAVSYGIYIYIYMYIM